MCTDYKLIGANKEKQTLKKNKNRKISAPKKKRFLHHVKIIPIEKLKLFGKFF